MLRPLVIGVVALVAFVWAPAKSAAGPFQLPQPQIDCGASTGGPVRVTPPTMAAHNLTIFRDWEYVAWRADLWTYDFTARQWTLYERGTWFWGWSYDDGTAGTYRDFDGNVLSQPYEFPGRITSGYGAVSILMYWWNPSKPGWYRDDSDYTWSGRTFNSRDSTRTDICYFG